MKPSESLSACDSRGAKGLGDSAEGLAALGGGCAARGGAKGGPGHPRPQWAVTAPPGPPCSGLGERATKACWQLGGWEDQAAAALTPRPGRRREARAWAAGQGQRRPSSP